MGKIEKYWDDIHGVVYDYDGQTQILHKLFKKNNVVNILDLGCGTGTHLIRLTKLGYKGVGIDKNGEMLKVAVEKAAKEKLKIDFVKGDIRNFKLKKKFDAIISLQVLSLLKQDEDLNLVFKNMQKHLYPKGWIVFDLLNAECECPKDTLSLFGNLPIPSIDVVIEKRNLKIIRLNKVQMKGNIQEWMAIYLVEESGKMSIHINKEILRFFYFEEVEKILNKYNFKIKSVIYADPAEVKKAGMLIQARLEP